MESKTVNTLEMLRAILGSIEEGIHAVNREGITIFYNEAAGRLDGLAPEEVIGKHVLDVFPSLKNETSTLLQVLATGKPLEHVRQTYTNVHGKKVHTVNSTLPIFSNGRLIGAFEVAKDLTQVKELAEKLIDLQASMVAPRKAKPRSAMEARYTFDDIVTCDPRMLQMKELAARAAATDSSVLVCGETGTGKELFVQAIHNLSPRRKKPFIAQNCAALPATLLEGLLFGTVKGSFTGAENRPGLFELADGGTLFLDEINSMSLELQAKLLRVLQEGLVRRIGDTKVTPVDVRVLAATNTDPLQAIQTGQLRPDLYYRLNVVSLHLPRLAERKADIPLLTRHFLDMYNERFQKQVERVSPDVERCFLRYEWPGNVRELQHAIEGAMNLVRDREIGLDLIPWQIAQAAGRQDGALGAEQTAAPLGQGKTSREGSGEIGEERLLQRRKAVQADPAVVESGAAGDTDGVLNPFGSVLDAFKRSGLPLREFLERIERTITGAVMDETNGNVLQAAKRLGIPRQTLQYRITRKK
ncbi:sigma-54 interaction domain-containing protein [Effusibacillus pohliae]|uniref:sigma-54 interaction domain-containing protein n=1 Tax=Effusibacillus pohliae TaxID=232270 RepID=UPI00037EBF74|nr:sigma-54-dependent Fis family transcriptional regulator [Effusibacillus pohliae]